MWHVSVSVRLWGEPIPKHQWRRQTRRAVKARIGRILGKVGEGALMWEQPGVTKISLQCRRSVNDRELARLPQHKLPEQWTEKTDERAVRAARRKE